MIIHPGTQCRLINETTSGAGVTSQEGSIQSDALLVTLWVDSVSSGSLSVVVYTLTDTGKEAELITFPSISAPTTSLLLKKSGVSMQRFRIEATYTGACTYEVYVRAIESSGESSTKLLGASSWKVSQETIGTSATVLIPASLDDRNGVLIKNWSVTQTIYLAETSAKATSSEGYPLAPRDAVAMDIAAGAEIYAVSDASGADVRLVESGG